VAGPAGRPKAKLANEKAAREDRRLERARASAGRAASDVLTARGRRKAAGPAGRGGRAQSRKPGAPAL